MPIEIYDDKPPDAPLPPGILDQIAEDAQATITALAEQVSGQYAAQQQAVEQLIEEAAKKVRHEENRERLPDYGAIAPGELRAFGAYAYDYMLETGVSLLPDHIQLNASDSLWKALVNEPFIMEAVLSGGRSFEEAMDLLFAEDVVSLNDEEKPSQQPGSAPMNCAAEFHGFVYDFVPDRRHPYSFAYLHSTSREECTAICDRIHGLCEGKELGWSECETKCNEIFPRILSESDGGHKLCPGKEVQAAWFIFGRDSKNNLMFGMSVIPGLGYSCSGDFSVGSSVFVDVPYIGPVSCDPSSYEDCTYLFDLKSPGSRLDGAFPNLGTTIVIPDTYLIGPGVEVRNGRSVPTFGSPMGDHFGMMWDAIDIEFTIFPLVPDFVPDFFRR